MSHVTVRQRSGLAHVVEIGDHELVADEPVEAGGTDEGPAPTQLLAASLASCVAITIALYTDRKEWDIEGLEVSVDFPGTPGRGEVAQFTVEVALPDHLDEDQRERIMVIAEKCPVHRILLGEVEIETRAAGASG
jgi:putative redox protein